MAVAFGLTISTALAVTGLCKVIWPAWLIDRDAADESAPPTPKEIRQSRWHGIIMLAFAAIGLYAILTWDGTPAEFIGV
jgi:hypothetical protein